MDNEQMQQTENDIRELEVSIEDCERAVKRMERLLRLEKNADFKELIDEGYFKDHAIRQVMLKSHPSYITDEKMQKDFDNNITGIGVLKQYFVAIIQTGLAAKEALTVDQETLRELNEGG